MRLSILILLTVFTLDTYGQLKLPKNPDQYVEPIAEMQNIMLDALEVTLDDWFAFMQSKYDEGYEDILDLAPSREAIPKKLVSSFDLILNQFTDDKFGDESLTSTNSRQLVSIPISDGKLANELKYPVTGISFNQVLKYIMWREDLMMESKKIQKAGFSVTARLLSPSEWDFLATMSGPRDIENVTVHPDSMNTHGCYLMNIRYVEPCESTLMAIKQYQEGLYPGAVFFPDVNGIYDFFGNVAEMTSLEGLARGGSFAQWGAQGTTGAVIRYDGPKEWLGFRVLFEFFEE